MQELVRVFVGEGTFCPGYQFQTDLTLNPVVTGLFQRALKLLIPHNYFALWMMLPCSALEGRRPVDLAETANVASLLEALDRTLAQDMRAEKP
uniref:Antitoxin Xre/MbcA/ParS-like toxin-binding domain-containing protein n=1 Tax=Arthrobacter sp. Chr15 TaxID=447032 RepID=A6YFP9_9MICC|nr:hypothetical protein [Arthrobacter sp. Chr15]ABR67060.1 unknown [Arthrobacter sp. Chr15]